MESMKRGRDMPNIWRDRRVNVWHLGMYMVLLDLWNRNGRKNPIAITRQQVMQLARFKSIATYHKCIKDLVAFGYIDYRPTYDYYQGTKVILKEE